MSLSPECKLHELIRWRIIVVVPQAAEGGAGGDEIVVGCGPNWDPGRAFEREH